MKSRIQHTIDIFERMYNNMPPLVPRDVVEKMGQALEQVKANHDITEDQLESTMIIYAKKIWPYNQAFQEIYKSYESHMAEDMFMQKLSGMLKSRYLEYKAAEHGWIDIKKESSQFFTPEERVELHRHIVNVTCELRAFAYQAVTHNDKKLYEDRIDEFSDILEHIELQLDALREVAEHEAEHPMLAHEIKEHVRGFEHGFAFLGPKVDYAAVCRAEEHFKGRKRHFKKRANHL